MFLDADRMSGFSGMRAVLCLVACPGFPACALSYPWWQVRLCGLARSPIRGRRSGFSGLRAVLSLMACPGFPACALSYPCVEPSLILILIPILSSLSFRSAQCAGPSFSGL